MQEEALHLFTRIIPSKPASSWPSDAVHRVGRGHGAPREVALHGVCNPSTPGWCAGAALGYVTMTGRALAPGAGLAGRLWFSRGADEVSMCGADAAGGHTSVPVDLFDKRTGASTRVALRAQRVVESSEGTAYMPLAEVGPAAAVEAAPATQGLRAWLPPDSLPAGDWAGAVKVDARTAGDGALVETLLIRVAALVTDATESFTLQGGDMTEVGVVTHSLNSGVHFSFSAGEGPTLGQRAWWGSNGVASVVNVKVRQWNASSGSWHGSVRSVELGALQREGARGAYYTAHAGRSANTNDHALFLFSAVNVDVLGAPAAGSAWRTIEPLVVRAHAWHAPNAGDILATMALDLTLAT